MWPRNNQALQTRFLRRKGTNELEITKLKKGGVYCGPLKLATLVGTYIKGQQGIRDGIVYCIIYLSASLQRLSSWDRVLKCQVVAQPLQMPFVGCIHFSALQYNLMWISPTLILKRQTWIWFPLLPSLLNSHSCFPISDRWHLDDIAGCLSSKIHQPFLSLEVMGFYFFLLIKAICLLNFLRMPR